MPRSLPPLNSLRAFEAAARHRSIRKAAHELHVTPAAISQQVKSLEEFLGVRLFRRVSRGLELTPEAEASAGRMREGFEALAGAVELLQARQAAGTVRVIAPPSFASKWLAPRIQRFFEHHPDAHVRIDADAGNIDARAHAEGDPAHALADGEEHDIAIRFGSGLYPGRRVDRLFGVAATPLCSPRLLEGEHPLRVPTDLRHHRLIHDDTISLEQGGADWSAWLRAAGVRDVDVTRGAHFNHAVLGLTAAIDGAGVVLSYPALASADIASGRLVAPFSLRVPVDFAYYAVSSAEGEIAPAVQAFRDWLVATAAEEPAP